MGMEAGNVGALGGFPGGGGGLPGGGGGFRRAVLFGKGSVLGGMLPCLASPSVRSTSPSPSTLCCASFTPPASGLPGDAAPSEVIADATAESVSVVVVRGAIAASPAA